MFVAVKIVWTGVVSDVQVRPAIVVVVSPDRAEAVIFVGIINAGFLGHLFECAVATIVKKQVGLPEHAPRSALDGDSLKAAVLLIFAEVRKIVHVEVNIAGDKQVDVAIVIVVAPGCARAEACGGYAGFISDILKLATAE